MPQSLTPEEIASIAEPNEALVYESLIADAALPGFGVRREGGARLLQASATPSLVLLNRVIGWGHGGEPADEASLDRIIAAYGPAGFGIEVSPVATAAGAAEWLHARRLRRVGATQVLARDARDPPSRYDAWQRATGLRVEALRPEQLDEMLALQCETFRLPEGLHALLARGTTGHAWRHWVALDGDELVGAALSHLRGDVAWFGWLAVKPSHRGRWLHTGILARQVEEAAAAGCRWVTTETALGIAGRPDAAHLNLKRFGFVDTYVRPTFVRAPVRPASQVPRGR